jgi:hypothetical protein
MDAILENIDRAFDTAFGLKPSGRRTGRSASQIKSLERQRIQSAENANYEFQIGDGVCLAGNVSKRGIIRSLDVLSGDSAIVEWIVPLNCGLTEPVPLYKLLYMPTLEQIYGKDPTDKQAIRDENCITAQIQREWSPMEERNHNCYPTPETQAVARLNDSPQQIRKHVEARGDQRSD